MRVKPSKSVLQNATWDRDLRIQIRLFREMKLGSAQIGRQREHSQDRSRMSVAVPLHSEFKTK